LLEKFDHYADTVEQHLIREISLRSTSFFAALTNLRDLQTSSTQCLSRIQNLRQKLKEVDEGTAKKGLELVRVKAKQDKVQEVREGVKMVEGVVEMMGVLKGLVGAGQWGEALNIVDEIEGMWDSDQDEVGAKKANGNGNPSVPNGSRLESMAEEEGTEEGAFGAPRSRNGHKPSGKAIPLSSLKAFGAIPSHLRTITMDIAASLSAELVAVLKDDWILYVEARGTEALKAETGEGSNSNGTNANTNGSVGVKNTDAINHGLRDRLRPLLLNLVRTKGLKEGMLSWREIIQGELKALVSKVSSISLAWVRF
jgi:vacuolar protein sorting-associated protein 54